MLLAAPSGAASPEPNINSLLPALALPEGSGPIEVQASLRLLDITEVNDGTETFQFSGILLLTWMDERQRFDPAVAGTQEKVYTGAYQVNELAPAWYPQVVLVNQAGLFELRGVSLRVKPDGSSTLAQMLDANVQSTFNMRRYPFDSQSLEAVFEVLGFDNSDVIFASKPETPERQPYDIHLSEWRLTDSHVSTGPERATLRLTIDLQRKPFFVIRMAAFPLLVIVVLSWSVFWMERSSLGDRINVSFIGILAAVAYMIVIAELLPHISYLTVLHAFISFSFLCMCATVVMNLLVGECDKRGNYALGDLIDFRCRWLFPVLYLCALLLLAMIAAFFGR